MGIIKCALNCKHQNDGYCYLETVTIIMCTDRKCPFYEEKLADKRNCLFKGANPNNLNR